MREGKSQRRLRQFHDLMRKGALTPREAARELGVSVASIEAYDSGTVLIPRVVILALRQVLRQEYTRANRLVDQLIALKARSRH